jgi:multidrug resistance protein MdtO
MGGSSLLDFLRAELRSTPGRDRATLRITLATLIATAIIVGFHIPEGHWLIITIFTVSQPDAGASLTKGLHRLVGTGIGGAAGILTSVVAIDQPWLLFPAVGILTAAGLFISRTCTAPYAAVVGTITFVLVALAHLDDASAAVTVGLWRIFLIALGVVIATGVQLLVWPDDPEELLLDDLARRLASVEGILGRVLTGHAVGGATGPVPLPDLFAASGLSGQLDLLASAEARHPAIRRRHPEQTALIIEAERLVTGSLWLERLASGPGAPPVTTGEVAGRLETLRKGCLRVRRALQERRPLRPGELEPVPRPDPAAGTAPPGAFLATLGNMEQSLARISPSLEFLDRTATPPAAHAQPSLDAPASTAFFTAGFSTQNTDAIRFALKVALGVEVSYLAMVALDWPAIFTCVVTCITVAQSTLGATLAKSVLRVAGSLFGALLAFLEIAVVMPSIESIVPYLASVAVGFGIAAWITTGSSRISYAGVQIGMAFALVVVDAFAPAINFLAARDRVLGILLGITIMVVIDHTVWPVRASRSMRPTLAGALRSLAGLARMRPVRLGYAGRVAHAVELRGRVYRDLAATLRLREESRMEPGAASPAAIEARERALHLTGDVQAIFLALLVLTRHRLTASLAGELPAPLAGAVDRFHEALGAALEALAAVVAGQSAPARPDLPGELDRLERAAAEALAPEPVASGPQAAAAVRGLLAIDREVVGLVARLETTLETAHIPGRPVEAG